MSSQNKFKIVPAHSGTESTEIAKAKRHFAKENNLGNIWASALGEPIEIAFDDTNNHITARFNNCMGQEICPPCGINYR